jgi:hypothetical protein
VNLVGEIGVFDGVTQAVSATECNCRSRFGERAEGHDRSGCHGECKDLHGFPPDRTCRSPPSHVDSFSNKRFHNRSWLNHSSHVHIQLIASVVQCILVRAIALIPKFAAFPRAFVCGLWNPKSSKLMNEQKVAHAA